MDPGKDHKADIKSTRKTAVERQYNKDKYCWQFNRGRMLKLKNELISSRTFFSICKLVDLFS